MQSLHTLDSYVTRKGSIMLKSAYLRASLFIVVAALTAGAQSSREEEQSVKKKDVPKPVLEAFGRAYPKATVKGYSRETDEGKVVYEVESTEGRIHRDVLYTPEGAVVVVEESLPYKELPEAVRTAITKEYPQGKVSYCEKLMKSETTQYEVALKSGKHKYEIVLNSDGTITETEKK